MNKTWIDGMARNNKIKTGKDVHIISKNSLVRILRLSLLLVKVTQKTTVKKETIRNNTIIAWS